MSIKDAAQAGGQAMGIDVGRCLSLYVLCIRRVYALFFLLILFYVLSTHTHIPTPACAHRSDCASVGDGIGCGSDDRMLHRLRLPRAPILRRQIRFVRSFVLCMYSTRAVYVCMYVCMFACACMCMHVHVCARNSTVTCVTFRRAYAR